MKKKRGMLEKKRKVILKKKINKKIEEKLEKNEKVKKKEKSTVDYYCNPQCIRCGHPLVLCIIIF
jgi:hypothetical protein